MAGEKESSTHHALTTTIDIDNMHNALSCTMSVVVVGVYVSIVKSFSSHWHRVRVGTVTSEIRISSDDIIIG